MQLIFTGERAIPEDAEHPWVFVEHLARYRFAQSFVPGLRVLDAACGVGYGTALLARAGAEIAVGIDIDADSIEYAKERYGSIPRTRYVHADIQSLLDVFQEPFDFCVSFETIEHLREPERFLRDARHLLVTGGRLLISTPNRYLYSPTNYDGYHSNSPFHWFEWTPPEFVSFLSCYFRVLSVYGQIFFSRWTARLFHWREWIKVRFPGTQPANPLHWIVGLRYRPPMCDSHATIWDAMYDGAVSDKASMAEGAGDEPALLSHNDLWNALCVRSFFADEVPVYVVCLCQKE